MPASTLISCGMAWSRCLGVLEPALQDRVEQLGCHMGLTSRPTSCRLVPDDNGKAPGTRATAKMAMQQQQQQQQQQQHQLLAAGCGSLLGPAGRCWLLAAACWLLCLQRPVCDHHGMPSNNFRCLQYRNANGHHSLIRTLFKMWRVTAPGMGAPTTRQCIGHACMGQHVQHTAGVPRRSAVNLHH